MILANTAAKTSADNRTFCLLRPFRWICGINTVIAFRKQSCQGWFFISLQQMAYISQTDAAEVNLSLPSFLRYNRGNCCWEAQKALPQRNRRKIDQIGQDGRADSIMTKQDDVYSGSIAEQYCIENDLHYMTINDQSFDISGLMILELPFELKTIEDEAFRGCLAQVIIIPYGCTRIGSKAFANCPNLQYVFLPKGISISSDALQGSDSILIYQK